ncbi:LOW QUALITY PROTEIN: Hypothetical protein PHPALM_13875 [Phytophthora palmivora]|uniref:Uncharacterized protein n=1 Tax=Phytophthora palmivora TaxID=4796 RepID=A0A2P4XWH3_9STRA|nr:LOW QUALITY PROTEIN: Hypothetical protein PHPALM_13875 [Phytophthora palmivora]
MAYLNSGQDESSSSEDDNMIGMDDDTSTQVCASRDRFDTRKLSNLSFKVWDGQVVHGVTSGDVAVNAVDHSGSGLVRYNLQT